ncbi:hypothetical protein CesoFtcFv8_005860 [Champsocephalus esox]|uniref:Uncharacterized protein n=1 Tax=Champsocephalus esox TaxID=159716 RepID=A0AAN8CIM5_9TELE|nr:hypothetical protein CesoFtcFv8_005860 [Champsocephalus esox]
MRTTSYNGRRRDGPSHLSSLPRSTVPLRDAWGEERREESSLSLINIVSKGDQNGLCQQNTGLLLSREEREDGGGVMDHPIHHVILDVVKTHDRVKYSSS